MTGDGQARICEGLGVKFPGATRRVRSTGVPTATPNGPKLAVQQKLGSELIQ